MQVFKKKEETANIHLLKQIPLTITNKINKPAVLEYKKMKIDSGCIGCINRECIYFNQEEYDCKSIKDFPIENNNFVCPINAIEFDSKKNVAKIDNKKCINCGLCASRCPFGAIYFDGKKTKVNYIDVKYFDVLENKPVNVNKQITQIDKIKKINKRGVFIVENEELLTFIYKHISKFSQMLQNLFVRNILIQLGFICSLRRIGDVYTRMDAIYSDKNENFGVAEIEYGKDTLESSRGLLDDIAVMNVRYKMKVKNNNPLLICLQLPNVRQGYWQVVKDIKKIEKISINTISIGGLLILLWNNIKVDIAKAPFYLDYDNYSLRENIESRIKRKIKVKKKYLGIFEPEK